MACKIKEQATIDVFFIRHAQSTNNVISKRLWKKYANTGTENEIFAKVMVEATQLKYLS